MSNSCDVRYFSAHLAWRVETGGRATRDHPDLFTYHLMTDFAASLDALLPSPLTCLDEMTRAPRRLAAASVPRNR